MGGSGNLIVAIGGGIILALAPVRSSRIVAAMDLCIKPSSPAYPLTSTPLACRMEIRQLIGYGLIALIFVGIFVFLGLTGGWRVTVIAFAIAAGIGALAFVADWLVHG